MISRPLTSAPPATASPGAPPRIAALDGLRGVAIALVLVHHYVQLNLPVGPAWSDHLGQLLTLTWAGVDLFFVLSGFLIGGLLIAHRDSPRLVPAFYLRRGLRILPLYYVTLLFIFIRLNAGDYALLPAWSYATFTANIGMAYLSSWDSLSLAVMWSLAVEEQFYLLAPWLIRKISPDRLPRALLGLIAAATGFRILLRFWDTSGFSSHLLMPTRMDAFGLGMLAAWAAQSAPARAWLARTVSRWWLPLLAAAPLLAALTFTRASRGDWHLCLYGYTAIAAVCAWIIYVAAVERPPLLVSVLSWPPLVSLGRLSYCVYLWHSVILAVVVRRLSHGELVLDSLSAAALIALAFAVTWILAAVSWRFFEGPFVRLGQRYAY